MNTEKTPTAYFKINKDTQEKVRHISAESGMKVRALYREALEVGLPEIQKKYVLKKEK